jgi:hypothetical protein
MTVATVMTFGRNRRRALRWTASRSVSRVKGPFLQISAGTASSRYRLRRQCGLLEMDADLVVPFATACRWLDEYHSLGLTQGNSKDPDRPAEPGGTIQGRASRKGCTLFKLQARGTHATSTYGFGIMGVLALLPPFFNSKDS